MSKAQSEQNELLLQSPGGPTLSLADVHGTISVKRDGAFFKRLLSFVGPGYLIAVGYMDPGNWATDIAGGAQYGYLLLSVVLISSLLAIFLQALSARLGIAARRDLAQCCAQVYRKPVRIFLWISAEIAIVACDVAEVLGAAIALNLLFHIPLLVGVLITSLDVLLVLALQNRGFRWIEGMVILLIGVMVIIFSAEVFMAHPALRQVFGGFMPHWQIVRNGAILYLALSILGATVMPHNLYLHSALVQTRKVPDTDEARKDAAKMVGADNFIALMIALFVNAAILVLSAATFFPAHKDVGDIQTAFKMLTPILGTSLAAPLFAVALLASGQNSTLTGTLAGQVILEGFTSFRIAPWLRRLISRLLAIVPAVVAIALWQSDGLDKLMIFSQVVLSIQLPMALIPLVQFTGDRRIMGPLVVNKWIKGLGWLTAIIVTGLDIYMVATSL